MAHRHYKCLRNRFQIRCAKSEITGYYNLIFEEIEFIAENPLTGKDYSHIRKNYRSSIVKSHLVFYRINNKKHEVEIIRVLHKRMDVEDRMK